MSVRDKYYRADRYLKAAGNDFGKALAAARADNDEDAADIIQRAKKYERVGKGSRPRVLTGVIETEGD